MLPLPKSSVLNQSLDRGTLHHITARNPSLLWLDKNENTDPILAQLTGRLLKEIDSTHCLSVYPESTYLYTRLSNYLKVPDSNIIISTGSDGVIRSIFEAYCNDGDRVFITNPTYAMYEVYSLMYGADLIKYDYVASKEGPNLNFYGYINEIKRTKPKLIFIPNPDSPTGTVIEENKLVELIKLSSEIGAIIAIDEAYYPFYNHSMINYTHSHENLIVIRTFSKAWGLTGLRVGFGVGTLSVINMLRKVRHNYETNSIGFEIANKMLDYENEMLSSVKRLNEGRDFFLSKMQEFGLQTISTNASFLHVKFGIFEKEIHEALSKIVLYRQGFNQECLKGFSRFSATSVENFKSIINCIEKVIQK